ARVKRRAYREETYWGRPIPGFGPESRSFGTGRAELLILGLAPAAHGGNRTGRVFTGDRAGDFLFEMLYRTGFANQPTSIHRDDGLRLRNAYVTATLRCAPPKNKPLPSEILNCRPYLEAELDLVRPRAVLALGRIAFDGYLKLLQERGVIENRAAYQFRHGASYQLPAELPRLFAAYHPSQQNTQTGRLTPAMFLRVLRQIRRYLRTRDS
ncbi:MAG: uracil-DNA glycosylase, partial [Terriglobia bacterium]